MTKEEFKKKYHEKVIEIPYNILMNRGFIKEINQVTDCCKEVGLKVTPSEMQAPSFDIPKKFLIITDPTSSTTKMTGQNFINCKEFLADFFLCVEEEEKESFLKAETILDKLKIEHTSIGKKCERYSSVDVIKEGFIQGYASIEASLWWHPLGRCVLFIRGGGAFEII